MIRSAENQDMIAIDPGVSGGIAWESGNGGAINQCCRMPQTDGELLDLMFRLRLEHRDVFIEKISGFIPDGGASRLFTFGESYGMLRGVCLGLRYRVQFVNAKDWQKGLGLGKSNRVTVPKNADPAMRKAVKSANAKAKAEWKRKLCDEARRRNPELGNKVTLLTCDALLILDYARIITQNEGRGQEAVVHQVV